jgi:soluble lytic murein transglycosylase
MKIARSFALAGDTSQALSLYDDLSSRVDNQDTLALIHLRKGEIFTQLGEMDKAYEAYLVAVNEYPSSIHAYNALVILVEAGISVDELNRGIVDFYAGEYGAALAAFDRYLNQMPADPGTAFYFTGLAHNKAGRYDQAIKFWDKLIQQYPEHPYWDKAWEQKGFTQWYYQDDFSSGIETFLGFALSNPAHPRAAEFLFNAGRVAERSGDLSRAAEIWRSVTLQYPNDKRARDGLFLSGISHFRQGDFSKALQDFNGALGTSQDALDRSRAYFWIGKTYQKLEDSENANKFFTTAGMIDPTGYYSERAQDILNHREPFTPPLMFDFAYDPVSEKQKALEWILHEFSITEGAESSGYGSLVNEPAFQRGTELWKLGLYNEARLEFESLRSAVANDPLSSFYLADYFTKIGLHRSATFAARNVLDLAGMDDSSTLIAPMYFNRIRFPTYYSDIIIPVAEEFNLHPLLIYSVIRQESLFESFVQSHASAQGLMQIIPSTGEEIAQELGWPDNYTQRDLYRPIVNIRFGAAYLAKQLDFFNGDLYAALAAYNGGPGNSLQWKNISNNDPDLFVEIIRFPETQDYVRRIYEIFSIYRRLYDRSP